ncbi:MAG: response regulator transcription factor [Oscillospiraceae bacterium]|nr:response regulator transcription factor [Oscillospiraceae bacterium]
MLQVAIIEDDPESAAHLRSCLDYLAEAEKVQFSVTEFSSGLAFLGDYKPIYDIVLMDIEMPGMNGMETARALRQMDKAVILIFVTNVAQYALQGYEVDAMNYILKPVSKYDFALKLRRALSRAVRQQDELIRIKTARDTYALRLATVRYLEVDGHYIIYHTTEGDFTEYITLKDAQKKLNKDYFARCNRHLLVNLKFVTGIEGDDVLLGMDRLPISRPQKKAFLKEFAMFIGGVN